jgi:hypothetical protein
VLLECQTSSKIERKIIDHKKLTELNYEKKMTVNVKNGSFKNFRIKIGLNKFTLLHKKEVKMNLVLFLLAGFETTSSSLSYCFYLLSQYPDVMEKLQDEIDSHFPIDSPEVCFFKNEKKKTFYFSVKS